MPCSITKLWRPPLLKEFCVVSPSAGQPAARRASDILGQLAERGHRMTGPRQSIVEYLAPRTDNFSAGEILDHLHRSGVDVGRATVFRTLDLLADLGLVHRIHMEDGCNRYAVCDTTRHHHHLVCVVCGSVQPADAPRIEAEIHRFAAEAGFEIVTHVVELVGRCRRCAAT